MHGCNSMRDRSVSLKKGVDRRKDQSYVLFSLTQDQLRYVLFPIGENRKEEVRQKAFNVGLRVHDKPESQEICFIHETSYHSFFRERVRESMEPGPIVDQRGKRPRAGTRGFLFIPLGRGEASDWPKGNPFMSIGIDREKNALIVGRRRRYTSETFIVNSLNWMIPLKEKASFLQPR